MKPVESITKSLAKELDKLNQIREDSLRLSREIIRSCSKSIRNVHRNELKDAKTFLKEAEKKNTQLKNSLKNSPELRFAGYIVEAEKAYTLISSSKPSLGILLSYSGLETTKNKRTTSK